MGFKDPSYRYVLAIDKSDAQEIAMFIPKKDLWPIRFT